MRNANKSPTNRLFRDGEVSRKVIRNMYRGPDHHQKLTRSSDWQAQSQHRVSVKSADYFCNNPAHRHTDRMNDRMTDRPTELTRNSALVQVTITVTWQQRNKHT